MTETYNLSIVTTTPDGTVVHHGVKFLVDAETANIAAATVAQWLSECGLRHDPRCDKGDMTWRVDLYDNLGQLVSEERLAFTKDVRALFLADRESGNDDGIEELEHFLAVAAQMVLSLAGYDTDTQAIKDVTDEDTDAYLNRQEEAQADNLPASFSEEDFEGAINALKELLDFYPAVGNNN